MGNIFCLRYSLCETFGRFSYVEPWLPLLRGPWLPLLRGTFTASNTWDLRRLR